MNKDHDLEQFLRRIGQESIKRPDDLITQTTQRMRAVHPGKKGEKSGIIGKNARLVIATSCLLILGFIGTSVVLPLLSRPTSPGGSLNQEPVILQGSNLANLGLRLDIEALEPLTYPNKPKVELNYLIIPDSFIWTYDPTMDVLAFEYPDYLSIELALAMYLQGFEKSNEPDVEQFIEVGSEVYNILELDEYKLFEDEDVLVFDITDLLFEEDFATRNNWVDQWGIDVYKYLRSHEDVAIVYADFMRFSPWNVNSQSITTIKISDLSSTTDYGKNFIDLAAGDVPHLKIGEIIELDFAGNPPDSVQVLDHLLTESGVMQYNDTTIIKREVEFRGDKGRFPIDFHFASFLSSQFPAPPSLRGYRFICTWGEEVEEYVFVIRTDAFGAIINNVEIGTLKLDMVQSGEITDHKSGSNISMSMDELMGFCALLQEIEWEICQGFWGIKLLPHYPEKSVLLSSENGEMLFNLVGKTDQHGYVAIYQNPSSDDLSNWEELQNSNLLLLTKIPEIDMDRLESYIASLDQICY